MKALNPNLVTFVETGVRPNGGGEEDSACADYITSLLLKSPINGTDIQNRVLESRAAVKFLDTQGFDFPKDDLEHALKLDCFQFAMKVERVGNLSVLKSTKLY